MNLNHGYLNVMNPFNAPRTVSEILKSEETKDTKWLWLPLPSLTQETTQPYILNSLDLSEKAPRKYSAKTDSN